MNEEISKNMLKSGTSLVGIVCKDGVIIGSDRRSTAGGIVLNKNSRKSVLINDFLIYAATGGVADIKMTKKIIEAELRLKQLKEKSRPSVEEAANMAGMFIYKSIRSPSMIPHMVGALIGGFNEDGTTELYTIEPAGSVVQVENFDANFSSGMPYILGLLERQWKPNLTIDEGVQLAIESLKSSTQRDTASGNGIDVFAITKDGIKQVVSQEITPNYK